MPAVVLSNPFYVEENAQVLPEVLIVLRFYGALCYY